MFLYEIAVKFNAYQQILIRDSDTDLQNKLQQFFNDSIDKTEFKFNYTVSDKYEEDQT